MMIVLFCRCRHHCKRKSPNGLQRSCFHHHGALKEKFITPVEIEAEKSDDLPNEFISATTEEAMGLNSLAWLNTEAPSFGVNGRKVSLFVCFFRTDTSPFDVSNFAVYPLFD